jgi:hypothetical protein
LIVFPAPARKSRRLVAPKRAEAEASAKSDDHIKVGARDGELAFEKKK